MFARFGILSDIDVARLKLGLVLSTSAYLSLIPTLWYLLIHKTNNPSLLAITSACVTHAIHLPSKSGFKAASTQLIGIFALVLCFHLV